MAEDTGYNGWTNYETWSVALIINNEQGTQEEAFDIVRRCQEDHENRTGYGAELAGSVSHFLKEWISEWVPMSDQFKSDGGDYNPFGHLWTQLIGAALCEVNWYELAESFIRDVEEIDQ